MADDAKKTTANEPASGKRKSRSSVALGLTLFVAAVGGGSFWFVQQKVRTEAAAQENAPSSAPKYLVHLEGFTVNLADPQETHFLRTTIDLGIDRLPEGTDKEKPAQALPIPRIRDAILSVLTVCKADDLLTPEGKTQLKKNLVDALNKNVPEIGVRAVYFTEFLVQR